MRRSKDAAGSVPVNIAADYLARHVDKSQVLLQYLHAERENPLRAPWVSGE